MFLKVRGCDDILLTRFWLALTVEIFHRHHSRVKTGQRRVQTDKRGKPMIWTTKDELIALLRAKHRRNLEPDDRSRVEAVLSRTFASRGRGRPAQKYDGIRKVLGEIRKTVHRYCRKHSSSDWGLSNKLNALLEAAFRAAGHSVSHSHIKKLFPSRPH
jgi:hypothetical protein